MRPTKCRKICGKPKYTEFCPRNDFDEENVVTLLLDEYETIRLIDYEGKTQEECAKLMNVARTTVTDIYSNARYKISDSLINGKKLIIEGGNYELCNGNSKYCSKKCILKIDQNKPRKQKGENEMKLAVTYDNGEVFQHFGHTEQFKIYDIKEGKVINEEIVDTNGSGHGALATFLYEKEVDALICGGIGGGAKNALDAMKIRVFGGVSGNADEAVNAFLSGNLLYVDDVSCNHHDEGHDCGGEHHCGDHGCGRHGCH